MTCPVCGTVQESGTDRIVESRLAASGGVRRRRECRCGHRFSTIEKTIDEVEEQDDEGTPLRRLSRDLEIILLRYERASKDEPATLGRAVVLFEQVTTAIARAYADSAEDEARQAKREKQGRRGAA
jgi:hypothetical protein